MHSGTIQFKWSDSWSRWALKYIFAVHGNEIIVGEQHKYNPFLSCNSPEENHFSKISICFAKPAKDTSRGFFPILGEMSFLCLFLLMFTLKLMFSFKKNHLLHPKLFVQFRNLILTNKPRVFSLILASWYHLVDWKS